MTFSRRNIVLTFTLFGLLPIFALASTTNGTIDSTFKYAWGNQIGWLNFGTSGGAVQITDSALTGYVWSQNYGWINLGPAGSGVKNDTNGNLSGYAWGQNLGYINFSGVTINSSGQFAGTASGTVAGQISFGCANCKVVTDWRPASARTSAATTAATAATGGGGGNPAVYAKPSLPLSVFINGGAAYTDNPNVVLTFAAGSDSKNIAVSNSADFNNISQEPLAGGKTWNLCWFPGGAGGVCPEGNYTVYVKFYTFLGQVSDVVSASIIYSKKPLPGLAEITSLMPSVPVPQLSAKPLSFLGKIKEKIETFLGGLFGPRAIPIPRELARAIPPIAPEPLKGIWALLPSEKLDQFVFAPLPKDIKTLAQKIPTLQKIFAEVGVNRQADLYKLRGVDFQVSGLASLVITVPKINEARLAPPIGMPLSALGPVARQKLPSEIVFARSADEKIDFNIKLRLNEQGKIEKRIETVVGSTIKLVVRAGTGAKSVKGYLVFRSKYKAAAADDKNSISLRQSLASLIFSAPTMAEAFGRPFKILPAGADLAQVSGNESTPLEERLALREFDYTEPYHDGVFVAEIPAPRVPGEYDVITVIQYKDSELGSKEIRLTAVVDPEGYVYEQTGNKETRLPDAAVSLYALNQASGRYEIWPAKNYSQENPQVTDVRGTYSFLVPQGSYYLIVEASGYLPYKGNVFSVDGANEVHFNVELKPKYGFLEFADWKSVIFAIVVLLLLYNFYGDWKRSKEIERSER